MKYNIFILLLSLILHDRIGFKELEQIQYGEW